MLTICQALSLPMFKKIIENVFIKDDESLFPSFLLGMCTTQNRGVRTCFCHCPIVYIKATVIVYDWYWAIDYLCMILIYYKMSVLFFEDSATDLFNKYDIHIQFFCHTICIFFIFQMILVKWLTVWVFKMIPDTNLGYNLRFKN